MPGATRSGFVRFGPFRLDLAAGELYEQDQKIRLQEQPFQVLEMLVDQAGELVSREQIRDKLWPHGTVVDFDHSINTAIKKLRLALGDPAEKPRYIETVARRGYRLMVPVEQLQPSRPVNQASPQREPEIQAASQTAKKVSHYRVLEMLGGGGMGVVYAAEDLKLGRRVALKFLPQELGSEARALGRFEREARAASTLNHPNICTIHEFGEHEGQPFIVMELLEGQTLRDRISEGGRLPTNRLLNFALQIAEGLEAAHQKGIIHRDIKPANIFLTNRGEAKILDFGLARVDAGEDLVPHLAETEVSARPNLSWTGIAMGTAAYMSPEQVRGEKLDTRTDLFSFGLVLYEMATGRQAFEGETGATVYAAILNREPAAARSLNSELPLRLEQIINRALRKDRQLRYQTASEMRAALKSLAVRLPLDTERAAPARRRNTAVPLAAAVATLLLIAAVAFWFVRTQSHSVRGALELKQRQLTTNSNENAVSSGCISPDGRYLAYADLAGMHVKLIETGQTRTVPQPEVLKGMQVNWGIATNWVRDGSRFIATANVQGKPPSIWVVPALTGAPRKLRDDAYAWAVSRDGAWVAFNANPGRVFYREMWLMRPDGTHAAKLYEGDDENGFFGADWSPDGQRLSYFAGHLTGGKLVTTVESRSLKGGPVVVSGTSQIADWTWSPDGHIIYILQEASPLTGSCNFWEIRVDSRTGETIGSPRRLTNWAGFCMQDPTVTADGKRLAFRKLAPQGIIYVADIQADRTSIGAVRRLTLNEGQNYPFAWTPDSKAVLFGSYRDGRWSIFRQSLDEDAAEPIVSGAQGEAITSATASPNGAWLLYVLAATEPSAVDRLMRVPIKGGSPELVLTGRIYEKFACARSPATVCVIAEPTSDRKQLIFTAFDPQRGRGGELTRFNTDPAAGNSYVWDFSPDGTRIAILSYPKARIDVLPLDGQPIQTILVKGWSSLLSLNWASDGQGIFASSQVQKGSVLLRLSLKGEAHVLWQQSGSIAPWNRPFGDPGAAPFGLPSPDGRYLAIYGWSLSGNMWMIENF